MSTELPTISEIKEKSPEQPVVDSKKESPNEQPTATTKNTAIVEPAPTVNYNALKELEGSILSSFKELVKKVILLNRNPFSEFTYKGSSGATENLKITSGRKRVYSRLIEDFAVLEFIGNKCRVAAVLDEKSVDKALNKAKKAKLQKRFKSI